MTKKNLIVRIVIFVILLALISPAFIKRVKNESDNKDVLFAINYNSAAMVLSEEELAETLKRNTADSGIKTAIIAEESVNSLINSGYITSIKYNVLCHKYDDESEEIIKKLAENSKVHNDSYIFITKREEQKKFLQKWITSKYTEDEYVKLVSETGADVYVVYMGVSEAWQMSVGFDESKIENAKKNGYDIVLSLMLNAYTNTGYIKEIENLVDKYDVKYINIKKSHNDQNSYPNAAANYNGFCSMIKDKELYLLVTEETTQLSNQKPIGYDKLIESAEGRVIRGYDTIDLDQTNANETKYEKRYSQILNSVVDRNIRFVSVNQLTNGSDSMSEKSRKTDLSTKMAVDKLESIGYNTKDYDKIYKDYSVDRTLTSAAAMLMMILMCLTMIEWLMGKRLKMVEIIALVGGVLSVPFAYVAPDSILQLYPTLFAAIAPCFAITATLVYVKNMREKLSGAMFVISSALVALLILLLCAGVQCALLSGLDYYLNSLIFRGIKLSLIVPVAYTCVAYGIIFANKNVSYVKKISDILKADIKVYWILIAGTIGSVAAIYLIRSGNVNEISGLESAMRNTITELMAARPRTKEFLVGWPCLILFLYFVKNTKINILNWSLAVGSSILFASVINSFCHVFTSAATIYARVFNGLMIGAVVSAALLIVSHIAVKIIKKHTKAGK